MWPLGYMTGGAVPEQTGTEADVFEVDSNIEGDAATESTKSPKTKAVPETVASKSTGSISPEDTLVVSLPEVAPEDIRSEPEVGPDRVGVKGLPTGGTGATGKLNHDLDVFASVATFIACECELRVNLSHCSWLLLF